MNTIHSWNMNLSAVDLNLLKVLDALLETHNVSRAAARLNVTQPAVSHALKRLRELFRDPLIVRRGAVMEPTAAALQLKAPLAAVIAGTQSLLTIAHRFDPARDTRTFRLAMSDAMTIEALPKIVASVRARAPLVDLVVERGGPIQSCDLLINDRTDVALGVIPKLPQALRSRELYRDDLVCIADRSNRFLKRGRLSLEAFLRCPHVTMGESSDSGIQLDDILKSMGLERRIALTVPHYLAIPATVVGTDLVSHSRRKLLHMMRATGSLVAMPVPVPFPVPDLVFSLVWHPRHELDAAHVWLREIISRSLQEPLSRT
jgi:DNA-binding transcriptional LysR family regulator